VRQFFTLRFWLTLLALGGLALGVAAFARSRDSKADSSGDAGAASPDRTIDLISWVYAVQPPPGFEIVDGRTTTDLALILDGTRTMIVKAGTPGEVHCPRLTELAQCTVAADLLGDGVLWFSIVPGLPGATVQLPAVTQLLDGGWVRLANGWVVRHAAKVERSCAEASSSLNDFISTYGPDATSTFSFDQQELIKVTCPKTPGESTTTTSALPVVIDPGAPLDPTATSIDPATVDTGEAG
jgi:hypothetical protein